MTDTSRRPRLTARAVRTAVASGACLVLSLGLAACGDDGGDGGETADGKIKLTVATFNEFGYEGLIEEYNAMQDEVVVEQKKAGTANEHQDNLYTKLAAGSGLSDIEAIEVDWLAALMQESDAFVDLSDPEVEGRWLDWKTEAATDRRRPLIGYGTDIGPEGICYRADLFEKAGLPTDREEVAGLFGTWEDYFEAGRTFVKATPDVAWYDASGATAQAMINQTEYSFEDEDNTVIAVEQPGGQGGLRHRHRASPTRVSRPSSRSGARTGWRRSRTTASPRWPAPAGCSV